MLYFEHLQKFKNRELSLLTVASLPESARLGLAVELLALVRFETNQLNDMVLLLKRMLPQLPEQERLWILKEIDQAIEDCNACLGKKSSEHLDAMLLLSLSDEQRFSYAKHLASRLNPQQVLVSESALWGLVRLCPLLTKFQKSEVLPIVLAFIQTRTLPDADALECLQTVFNKVVAAERQHLWQGWLKFLMQNLDDEKMVLLILDAMISVEAKLTPQDKSDLLGELSVLFTHAHRKVPERLLLFYNRALENIPSEKKFLHLENLMQQEGGIEHLETICQILQNNLDTLPCPKQKKSVFRFLQRISGGGEFAGARESQ